MTAECTTYTGKVNKIPPILLSFDGCEGWKGSTAGAATLFAAATTPIIETDQGGRTFFVVNEFSLACQPSQPHIRQLGRQFCLLWNISNVDRLGCVCQKVPDLPCGLSNCFLHMLPHILSFPFRAREKGTAHSIHYRIV